MDIWGGYTCRPALGVPNSFPFFLTEKSLHTFPALPSVYVYSKVQLLGTCLVLHIYSLHECVFFFPNFSTRKNTCYPQLRRLGGLVFTELCISMHRKYSHSSIGSAEKSKKNGFYWKGQVPKNLRKWEGIIFSMAFIFLIWMKGITCIDLFLRADIFSTVFITITGFQKSNLYSWPANVSSKLAS